MKTICIGIVKGGSGKTATAAALAQAGAESGKRVLAIDCDPQANLTAALGCKSSLPGTYRLLHGAAVPEVLQKSSQGMMVMAGSGDLATEKTRPGSANRLRTALEAVQGDFDLCIIDNAPSASEPLFNALRASDYLLIPTEADADNITGMASVAALAKQLQPGIHFLGAVVTRYDGRPIVNRQMRDQIAQASGKMGASLIGTIRNGIAVRESRALKESLFKYAPKSKPAEDYMELYKKIEEVIE